LKAASPPPQQRFTAGRFVIDATGATDVGLHRDHNEDSLGLLPEAYQQAAAERGYLFAVADGMGGAEKGEVASEMAIQSLFSTYYDTPTDLPPEAALRAAFAAANEAVYREGLNLEFGMMGTTLVAALIVGDRVIIGNVGDSRAYLFRDEVIRQMSEDHSLVAEQVRAGLITPEQARRSSQRNIITRAIGHQPDVEDEQFEVPLKSGDLLMLCSDGLHGMVEDPALLRIAITQPDMNSAAASFIDAANARGGHDNITCLLVRVRGVDEPEEESSVEDDTTLRTRPLEPPAAPVPPRQQVPAGKRRRRRRAFWGGAIGLLALALVGAAVYWSQLAPAQGAAISGMKVSGQVILPPEIPTVAPGSLIVAVEGPTMERVSARVDATGAYTVTLGPEAPEGLYTLALRPDALSLPGTAAGQARAVYAPRKVQLARGSNLAREDLTYQIVQAGR
jgi:protein phosphatase